MPKKTTRRRACEWEIAEGFRVTHQHHANHTLACFAGVDAYVSLGTFLSSSAGCVAGGSRAAAPPPRRDSTSREEPPTPPSHRDELRPRTDSDNKPGSDESVSRQTDCSSHSSPSRRSRSHRAPPIHPATLAPTAPRGSATGRRRRSCRSSQRRSALQQPSSPARRAGQRPSCAIYQPRGLHMARGRRERILSQHPVLGGAALPTGPV